MQSAAKWGIGIAALGLMYALTRKRYSIDIVSQFHLQDNSERKGINFKACIDSECLSGQYVIDYVPKIIPFEQHPGYYLVLQGIPAFMQIRIGIGRMDESGAVTADFLRVVDFNSSAAISGRLGSIYERVVPRDFFNEAKLLKCMGRLALLVLDRTVPNGLNIEIEESGEPFEIDLTDGSELFVANYPVTVNGYEAFFFTAYNSKAAYPFYCRINDIDYEVFTDSGDWHPDFIQLSKEL